MEGVYCFNEIYNCNTKETSQQVYSPSEDQKGYRPGDWLQNFQIYISYRVNQVDAARRQVYSHAYWLQVYSPCDGHHGCSLLDSQHGCRPDDGRRLPAFTL